MFLIWLKDSNVWKTFSYLRGITVYLSYPLRWCGTLVLTLGEVDLVQQTSDEFWGNWISFGISLKELHVSLSWQYPLQTKTWATRKKKSLKKLSEPLLSIYSICFRCFAEQNSYMWLQINDCIHPQHNKGATFRVVPVDVYSRRLL